MDTLLSWLFVGAGLGRLLWWIIVIVVVLAVLGFLFGRR